VVRRLLRRAVLDGHQMGVREPFLYKLVPVVVAMMKRAYPIWPIRSGVSRTSSATKKDQLLRHHRCRLGAHREDLRRHERGGRTCVDGGAAAELYQTYGVPPEVFETMAAENNLAFDWDGYRKAMREHGEASGKVVHTVMGTRAPSTPSRRCCTRPPIWDTRPRSRKQNSSSSVAKTSSAITCASRAGSRSDRGAGPVAVLWRKRRTGRRHRRDQGQGYRFRVTDTQRSGALILHHGHVVGRGAPHRNAGRRPGGRPAAASHSPAHSATHILHYALQKNLGSHAQQQGSKVDEDWFGSTHHMAPVSAEQLDAIEQDANQRVAAAEPVSAEIVPWPPPGLPAP